MKIAILGYSGAGKSTLARELAEHFSLPVLHLDAVHHLPGWAERTREEECEIVKRFLDDNTEGGWVIDGTYKKVLLDRRLDEADLIILMLLGRLRCFFRAYSRYRKYKGKTRPDSAEGCEEKFDKAFAKWLLIDGRVKRRARVFSDVRKTYGDKTRVVKSARQVARLVKELTKSEPETK